METFDVDILFTSRIVNMDQPGASQITRSTLHGRIAEGAGSLYLIFSDTVEEIGAVDYTIKINGDEALIRRTGAVPMRQPLFIGKPMNGTYEGPYGTMATEATAQRIEATWDRKIGSGAASLVYDMTLQGEYVGQCRLDYRYTAK
ncbi:DUF1934 domain-containing protein [Sporolactobacillus sp. THM7-4]|nr:DUF1934 domain-containing protein [Sporolactobacillus sp. THM7-4]